MCLATTRSHPHTRSVNTMPLLLLLLLASMAKNRRQVANKTNGNQILCVVCLRVWQTRQQDEKMGVCVRVDPTAHVSFVQCRSSFFHWVVSETHMQDGSRSLSDALLGCIWERIKRISSKIIVSDDDASSFYVDHCHHQQRKECHDFENEHYPNIRFGNASAVGMA